MRFMSGVVLTIGLLVSLEARAQDGMPSSQPQVLPQPSSKKELQHVEPCVIGKPCNVQDPDKIVMQMPPSKPKKPTKQYQALLDDMQKMRDQGLTDPEKIRQLNELQTKLEKIDPGDIDQLKLLVNEFKNIQTDNRPFRVGTTFTLPIGLYSGAELGVQWEPPKLTEKLKLIFGGNLGIGYFSSIPTSNKVRSLFDASMTINYEVGPGSAFLGGNIVVAANPFQQSMLGFGPIAGYRWEFIRNWTADFTAGLPYHAPAWTAKPEFSPLFSAGVMYRFGIGSKETPTGLTSVN